MFLSLRLRLRLEPVLALLWAAQPIAHGLWHIGKSRLGVEKTYGEGIRDDMSHWPWG
jgi:hypothetical protein